MRDLSRSTPQVATNFLRPRRANRFLKPTVRKIAGGAALVVLGILFWYLVYQNLPGALHGVVVKPFSTTGPVDRTVKILTLVVGASIIAARWSVAYALGKNLNLGLAAFTLVVPLSLLWSIDSEATLLRYVTLAGIIVMCFAFTLAGWSRQRFVHVVVPPAMCILIGSLLVGIVNQDMVMHVGDDLSLRNSWHGVTHHKNQFGMLSSVIAIVCFSRWLAGRGRTFWSFTGFAIALICMILSRSSTSMFATALGLLFMVAVVRVPVIRQRYSTHLVIGIASIIVIYELAVQNVIPGMGILLKPISILTGKDMTLSSRTIIWEILKEHMRGAPWLGTGYAAYWTREFPSSPSYVFVYRMFFYPGEAHNGYLDITNDLGRLGIACLLLYLVSYVRQALQLMRFDRGQAAMYLALLFQQMVANLSESEWMSRSTICAIFTLATCCLSRDLLEYRRLAQSQSFRPPAGHR
jgi:O-antigen ligase